MGRGSSPFALNNFIGHTTKCNTLVAIIALSFILFLNIPSTHASGAGASTVSTSIAPTRCVSHTDCGGTGFCNGSKTCLSCIDCACEDLETNCHLTCDQYQDLSSSTLVAGLENSVYIVTFAAVSIGLFTLLLTCMQYMHCGIFNIKLWKKICKKIVRNKQIEPRDDIEAARDIDEKATYRYNVKVLLVDEETDENVCFLGQVQLKPSATVRDLEEQSVIVMEKAYKECTKKWSLDSDGKIYKNGEVALNGSLSTTAIDTTVEKVEVDRKKKALKDAKAAAEKNTINAAAKDVIKRAEMELKNAENALALKTAIKICTEKKSTIKHLLKGDEETIFIDKNDTENIFKFSDHTAALKFLQCGAKFKQSDHTTLLKKLEAIGSSELINTIIPVEICIPIRRECDVDLLDAMKYILEEETREKIQRGVLLYEKGSGKSNETRSPRTPHSPSNKKNLSWLRSKIKNKMFNQFKKSRDVSKLKIEFWAMRVHTTDITNAHTKLVATINTSSNHIVDNIQISGVLILGVIFMGLVTQLENVPLRHVFTIYLIIAASFWAVMELSILFICTKSKNRRHDQSAPSKKATSFHIWLYILFLIAAGIVLPLFIYTLVSSNGEIMLIPALSTPNLEIVGEGCNYLLSPSEDGNVKVLATVVNGYGSATWAKNFEIKTDGNFTIITVTPDADATAMINAALERAGFATEDDAVSVNQTSKFTEKSQLPTSLQYKCTIEIFIPPGIDNTIPVVAKNDLSIHVVQPEIEVHTTSVKDILNFKALVLDATDKTYGTINSRLFQIRVNYLHMEAHMVSAELTEVSSDYTELKAFEMYGAAEMILRGTDQTALRVITSNVPEDLVCVRSGGQLFVQNDNVAFLASNNDKYDFATLPLSDTAELVIQGMLKGYFAIDTNEGTCNNEGPSTTRAYSINDTIPTAMTFESESVAHFKAALSMYDIVLVTVWGYEVPFLSTWSFTNNDAYQYLSSSYISAFSLSVLAPSIHTVELHVDESTCVTGSHLNGLKEREMQVALALRNLIGEESELQLTFVNASGRFHRVPSYEDLEHGATLSVRVWSEPIQWIAGVSVGATITFCFILIFLWQSVGRVLYSERMEATAHRYCKEITTTRRETDVISERNLLYQKSIILPHLNFIHLLQLELYFNRKGKEHIKELAKWPWPGISVKSSDFHVFIFPIWRVIPKVTKLKINRLIKKGIDAVVMSAVILLPLAPVFLVSLLYRSSVLFEEFQIQPMDRLLMPLITVGSVIAACCLLFSFIDFIIVKASHAIFTRCSIDKKRVDSIFTIILSLTSSIKMIAYIFSAFCLGNIGCWVMLGILLKPEKAIPMIAAAGALVWHISNYSKTLNKLYESMNDSLTGAIDSVAIKLRKKSTIKLLGKINDLVDITNFEKYGGKLKRMVSILGRSLLNAPLIRVFGQVNFGEGSSHAVPIEERILNLHVAYMLGKSYTRKTLEEKRRKLKSSYPDLYEIPKPEDYSSIKHHQCDALTFFSRNISEFAYLYEIITDGEDIFEQLKSLAMVSPGGWEKPYLYLLRLKTRVSSIAEETDWAESKTVDRSLMELLVNGKVHVDTLYQLTGLQYPWMAICAMVEDSTNVLQQALRRNIGVTGYVSLQTVHAAYIVYRAALNSLAPHPTCKCRLQAKIGPDLRKKDNTGRFIWYNTDGPEPVIAKEGERQYYKCPRAEGDGACTFFVYTDLWHQSENNLAELLEKYTQKGEKHTIYAHNIYVFLQKHCPNHKDVFALAKAVIMLQTYLKRNLSSKSKSTKFNVRSIPGLFMPRKLLVGQRRLADQCLAELKTMIGKEKDRIASKASDFQELMLSPSSPKRKTESPSKSLLRPAIEVVPSDLPETKYAQDALVHYENFASMLVHDLPLSLKAYQNTILFLHLEIPGTITYEHFFHYFNFLTQTVEIDEKLPYEEEVVNKRKELRDRLNNFFSVLDLELTRLYQDNLVKTVSENTKDKVSGVLAKYGISIRTMVLLLIVSIVVVILLFALILYAQVAFGSPGMVSALLSSVLCLGGTFGVNTGLTKQNTSPTRIAKITEDSGQQLQKVTPDLSADFSRSLKGSIKQAAADQKKSFLNVQNKLQSIETSIQSQEEKMTQMIKTEVTSLEGKVGEQLGGVKDDVKNAMQNVKNEITRDVGKIKEDVRLSSSAMEDNFKHLHGGRAIEKQTYQQMQNLESSLTSINQRVMENQRSLMAEVAAGREVEQVLGTSFATNMSKVKMAKKLHRQLDVGRLQKAKKYETEILRLLHKAETGATLDFEVRSESLQCTSFWNLDRALNRLKSFYMDYPRYKERQMGDYVTDTYKKRDNLKPMAEAIERVVTTGELVHDRDTLNSFLNECRSMEKKHLALGEHVKDYINVGMEKIEQYMTMRRNEVTILVASYEIRDHMEGWGHRYEEPTINSILDLLHCMFLVLGYKDAKSKDWSDSHTRLQNYKGADTFKTRMMRLSETITEGNSSTRRTLNSQLGSKVKSITKLNMGEEKDTYMVVFYDDEKHKACQYTKDSAIYLSDTRWEVSNKGGTKKAAIKTDVFHGQEFIILENAKVLPPEQLEETKTSTKVKGRLSVLEAAAAKKSPNKRGKNSPRNSPRGRKKVDDEVKEDIETDEFLTSLLPKLPPRVTKEVLIQASKHLTWDNSNARHTLDTGYISTPFHNKVIIDDALKTKALNKLKSSAVIMKESNVHESIKDAFLWMTNTLDNITPPFEYRY